MQCWIRSSGEIDASQPTRFQLPFDPVTHCFLECKNTAIDQLQNNIIPGLTQSHYIKVELALVGFLVSFSLNMINKIHQGNWRVTVGSKARATMRKKTWEVKHCSNSLCNLMLINYFFLLAFQVLPLHPSTNTALKNQGDGHGFFCVCRNTHTLALIMKGVPVVVFVAFCLILTDTQRSQCSRATTVCGKQPVEKKSFRRGYLWDIP